MHRSRRPPRFGRSLGAALGTLGGLAATLSLSAGQAGAAPFFSEYVEGSGNNKALELYNPDGAGFDLGGCQVRMYFNGNASHSTASLYTFAAGSALAAGDVFVLAHPDALLAGVAVDATTSFTAWYNGDDAVALVCGGTTLDTIGQIGMDPGSEWGTGLTGTADNTLRRAARVRAGDANGSDPFDPALEWIGYASNTFDGLGSHSTDSGGDSDTSAPAIAGSVPANGATEVPLDIARIAVDFSEALDLGASSAAGATLECPAGSGAASGSAAFEDAHRLVFSPTGELPPAALCTLTIPAGALADLAGNANPAPLTIAFTTESPLAGCGSGGETPISAVQGSGAASPMAGRTVTLEAVVVGDYQGPGATSLQGYFIQEEDGDRDASAATSEGLFVFDPTTGLDVQVGDVVRIVGTVSEYFGMTQVTVGEARLCATGVAVTPAELVLPVPGVPNGDLAAAGAAIDAYYEPREGMLVHVPEILSVAEYFELERYGQLELVQGGRIATFTATNPPSPAGYIDHRIQVARRTLILDDGNNTQNSALVNATPLPYPSPGLSTTNRVRGGDTIADLTGVLHWSWAGQSGTDAWRVRPVVERYDYRFAAANERPIAPPDPGGSLRVASFNVLNYFSTIDTTPSSSSGSCGPDLVQDCRGADSAAELARQSAKAASALCAMGADIVGLMEIENNPRASLDSLVAGLHAVPGCGPYAYVDTGTIGGDAIKVALLYRPAAVEPVGGHAILDSTYDPAFLDDRNRPALAQTFRERTGGGTLTIAVNHFKSKGTACEDLGDLDLGDGQGNCNATRTAAAEVLVDWLADLAADRGDPDLLIVGDLNAYAMEDPIAAIESAGYTNLVRRDGGDAAYSYVFDGQTGYLDHALANPDLGPQVTGVAHWHINADEPPAFDYNDTVRDTGEASFEPRPAALPLYLADERRTSDHDPVLIGLDLTPPPAPPGDLSGDARVTWGEDRPPMMAALGSQSGQARYRADADFDGDGKVTLVDYRAWYALWVAGGRKT